MRLTHVKPTMAKLRSDVKYIMIVLLVTGVHFKSFCFGSLLRSDIESSRDSQTPTAEHSRSHDLLNRISAETAKNEVGNAEIYPNSLDSALKETKTKIDVTEHDLFASQEEMPYEKSYTENQRWTSPHADSLSDRNERRRKKSCRFGGDCGLQMRCDYTWRSSGNGTCTPLVANMQWCNTGTECSSGFCGGDFKCAAEKKPCIDDGNCTTGRCEYSSHLNESVCVELGSNGEYCKEDNDCKSKSCGSDNRCHAKSVRKKHCESDDDCREQQTCSPSTKKCYSVPRKIDESCDNFNNTCFRGFACGKSGLCVKESIAKSHLSVPKNGNIGDKCLSDTCQKRLRCNNYGFCEIPLKRGVGESCNSRNKCKENLYCSKSKHICMKNYGAAGDQCEYIVKWCWWLLDFIQKATCHENLYCSQSKNICMNYGAENEPCQWRTEYEQKDFFGEKYWIPYEEPTCHNNLYCSKPKKVCMKFGRAGDQCNWVKEVKWRWVCPWKKCGWLWYCLEEECYLEKTRSWEHHCASGFDCKNRVCVRNNWRRFWG